MSKKVSIIIIVVLAVVLVMFYFLRQFPDYSPEIVVNKIYSANYNETLYLKKIIRGVSYDSQIIILSKKNSESTLIDKSLDYVYEGNSSLFYLFIEDTLKIYTNKQPLVPENFNSQIEIILIQLSNPEMMNLYDTYKEKGLVKF